MLYLKVRSAVVACSLSGFEAVYVNVCMQQTAYHKYHNYRNYCISSTNTCWGLLGQKVQVVLSSFAVSKIRSVFPSEHYTGFRLPDRYCIYMYGDKNKKLFNNKEMFKNR